MTWIFAYGSLMGDNALRFYDGTPAHLVGFHRAFNHSSTQRWGSPAHPCPILGLSPGAEAVGVAFSVPRSDERDVLRKVGRREAQGEFERKRVRIRLADGSETKALVWLTHPKALTNRPWPDDRHHLEAAFRAAHGTVGTGVEYVRTLIHAMQRWQIRDGMIESLWESLQPYSNPKG